jgi:hypothetical protein
LTDRGPRRLSESTRVEAFSDGVFAIAITLLVLELAVPATSGEFGKELADEWVSYVAYLAAFANIGVLWMGHHTAFSRILAVDAGLLWRNLVLLLTVSVVPFPTAVIASAFRVGTPADQAAAVVSYAVVGMASGASPDPHRLRGGRPDRLVREPRLRPRDLPDLPDRVRGAGAERGALTGSHVEDRATAPSSG